jgi:predicted amidophosphoribosyltransferase
MAGPPTDDSSPERLRFGLCPHCAYASTGTPAICFDCASEVVEQIPGMRCPTCDGALRDDGQCGNPMCSWPVSQRGWRFVYSMARRSGVLEDVINRYKYDGIQGWAWIFARLLIGYLDENFTPGDDHQVIVSNPTYVGADGRAFDHTGLVLERARKEDAR